jgi:hypothetical protein
MHICVRRIACSPSNKTKTHDHLCPLLWLLCAPTTRALCSCKPRSTYNYKAKFILLAAQQGLSLLFCVLAKRYLQGRSGFEVPEVSPEALRASLWPGFLNVANIVVGWYGMALVNIPLFLCVRRTATAVVLLTEYWIRNKVEQPSTQLSVALICLGALVAGWDVILQGDSLGLMYTMMNNFLTAWSHTESKVFADKFNCHGCVLLPQPTPPPQKAPHTLSCAPIPHTHLPLPFQVWHSAVQLHISPAALPPRRHSAGGVVLHYAI